MTAIQLFSGLKAKKNLFNINDVDLGVDDAPDYVDEHCMNLFQYDFFQYEGSRFI